MTDPPVRTPSRVRRRILVVVAALGAVLVVAVGGGLLFLAGLASDYDGSRRTLPEDSFFPAPSVRPTTEAAGDAQNILLLGTDTRGAAPKTLASIRAQRSDTMLLVHVPADRKKLFVISIMRDSWVDIPGHGMGKINAALSYGGVPMTVQVVERLLGVRIDHVAIVSFGGFVGLTDALGGVQVDNRLPFRNLGHTFPQGTISLRGDAALAYVRARYPFKDGDYQRVRNQRAFLNGVIRSLTGRKALDPFAVRGAVRSVAPYLLTDEGLDSGYLGRLAISLRGVRSGDVVGLTVPTSGTDVIRGQSVVSLDDEAVAQLATHLRNDSMTGFDACAVSIC